MKKIKRIVICCLSFCLFSFIGYVLIDEFRNPHRFLSKLTNDITTLIPVFLGCFSFLSFLFSIRKLKPVLNIDLKSYKFLRISDLIFSISMIVLMVVLLYLVFKSINENVNRNNSHWIPLLIIFTVFSFSITLLVDNFLIHKKQKQISKKDIIDEIGNV